MEQKLQGKNNKYLDKTSKVAKSKLKASASYMLKVAEVLLKPSRSKTVAEKLKIAMG